MENVLQIEIIYQLDRRVKLQDELVMESSILQGLYSTKPWYIPEIWKGKSYVLLPYIYAQKKTMWGDEYVN